MWKINNILLQDQEYVKRITELFKEFENENLELNPSAHLDYLKYKIKMSSIEFSRVKSSKEKQQVEELNNTLKELLETHDMGKDNSIEIKTTQKDIEFLQNKKAQASIFRSKCNWSQHSEKPTKYFLNLENFFTTTN